ncbi:RNA polymerase sigma factor region1.1 domain-containing protein [Bradyrhizobium yuanmingense]|uniref:RNA polymerase sigma factor region1.1 domain-containing protein n=1 Tax=Bradyrhizobium yuanmingense TaxID=108015 RepID=UPI0023B97A0D|nr:RNA polymerase sigma factor region1.1 domain-containing protein [Bradyrhizobium yuanmingense]MDF0516379.1 RNA polymerase sigma factor region1.1 domain-containing protein [Bradyrhizobium yuanmingense]
MPEIIRRAIEIGTLDGRITFDELNKLCEGAMLDPKDIDLILNALSEAGIWIEGD